MYYLKKAAGCLVTIVLVSVITFWAFQILPGNAARTILGVNADEVQVQNLEIELGLNKNPIVRYCDWIKGLLKGDMGTSYKYRQSVNSIIAKSLNATVLLTLYAFFLTALIGLPLGIFLAAKKKNPLSHFLSIFSQIWISTPSFCTALLLIIIFTVKLNWLPSIGFTPFNENPAECIRSLTLPSLSLAFGYSSVLARYLRSSLLEEEKKDYVRTAKSKGLSTTKVVFRHELRNAFIPVLTTTGMIVAEILGGSIIIENVFSIPGIGSLITSAINARDFPLIQSLTLYLSLITVATNFIVDILYPLLDVRLRVSHSAKQQGKTL